MPEYTRISEKWLTAGERVQVGAADADAMGANHRVTTPLLRRWATVSGKLTRV
jgi:hypothetical protein